jgi:hypothetical protein
MAKDLIAHMQERVEKCRRLAEMITDERAANILRQMAEDGEADIRRLQAGQPGGGPEAA